ncbi:hypothetical protein D3C76_1160330 [compost metagenome]
MELADQLQAVHAFGERQENAGTVLVLNGGALIEQCGYSNTLSATHKLAISVLPDGRYRIHTQHESSIIDGNAELCSLLFDPDTSVEQFVDHKIHTLALPYMYGLYFI